jgi:hypothetical protein
MYPMSYLALLSYVSVTSMSSPSCAPDRAVTGVSTVRARSEHRSSVQDLYERWGMGAMESTQCSMLRQTDGLLAGGLPVVMVLIVLGTAWRSFSSFNPCDTALYYTAIEQLVDE